jgi:hypothetical protein
MGFTATGTAAAEWKAANNQVVAAAKNSEIAAVLEAVNQSTTLSSQMIGLRSPVFFPRTWS